MIPFRRVAPVLAVLCGCQAQVQHGLDERQANELQTVLLDQGVEARKVLEPGKRPTWAIEVGEDQAAEAIRVLSERGLPRPRAEGFAEVFGKGSLVPTPTEERALFLQALSGELSRTLESLDGVTSARVHLAIPAPPRPGAPPEPAKASALLRVRPGSAERIHASHDALRALIAGSVEGLTADSVTLVVSEAAGSAAITPHPSSAGRLRWLVVALAVALSVVAMVLVFLTVRLRPYRAQAAAAKAPPAPAKPLITGPIATPSSTRRAA